MNILIPHSWLLEHLETEATPQQLQELLSLSGPSVEGLYEKEGESVYDIEVTTNRVDSMSIRGIAREAAVILEQAGVLAHLKPLSVPAFPQVNSAQPMPLPRIEDSENLALRTMGIVLDSLQHSITPDWMAKRLKQIDQNVHDAVIDTTNYITHELGHPCHAFDYDKIMSLGGVIKIVTAEAGKKFKTLDGVEYTTVGGEIVFENEAGEIIDFPAIKGTANTSIDDSTKRVLLWMESLPAKKVRFGSMSHAIRTVAAQLNEKNVDPTLGEAVLQRGVQLYQELCGATVASEVHDHFPAQPQPASVKVSTAEIEKYLGISLEKSVIVKILQKLECQVREEGAALLVTPPSFRPDIEIPADVIEEVARIYGYHNLPSTLMPTAIPVIRPTTTNFAFEHRCKTFLADLGWQELYTYSMVSEKIAVESGYSLEEHLKLQNPLTDDHVYLRRSLVPSLNEILDQNSEKTDLCVFELAHVYQPEPIKEGTTSLPKQELHLTLLSQLPYRETRGVCESLLEQFFTKNIKIEKYSNDQEKNVVAKITATHNNEVVELGTVQLLPKNRVAFDFVVSQVLKVIKTHPNYKPLPKAESVSEDLTFVLREHTEVGGVMETIQSLSPYISDVQLVSQYQQNYSFSIKYLHPDHSLSSTEVEPIRKSIVDTVKENHQGQLVGTLS